MSNLKAIAYGGGVNSTAMILLLHSKGIKADFITFADTGAEKPHTYQHLTVMNNWLLSNGWPQITIVKKNYRNGEVANLYDHSFSRNMLPSLAYGFKNCSQKFKIQPQEKACNNFQPFKDCWASGGKVIKYIGYDIDEPERVKGQVKATENDKKYIYENPLFDEGWDRERCIEEIRKHGLPVPGKSACYFCPASTKGDILRLNEHYPELMDKALALEANADLDTVKGLGRRFAWSEVVEQGDLFNDFGRDWDLPCGCFDGEDE